MAGERTYGQRRIRNAPPAPAAPLSARRRTLQTRVTYAQHAKAHVAAEALGISVSAFLAELIDRMEVDELGRPAWTSRYARQADAETNPEADPMRMSA
ncbi:hypothetical protein GALL_326050 [mine drainage metagenome]|uniref:Uncharacterized protein n=1 Tax=mine drainage metagenome TaxID=410659 RepID=A0A1J5QQ94_9ZZZZ